MYLVLVGCSVLYFCYFNKKVELFCCADYTEGQYSFSYNSVY